MNMSFVAYLRRLRKQILLPLFLFLLVALLLPQSAEAGRHGGRWAAFVGGTILATTLVNAITQPVRVLYRPAPTVVYYPPPTVVYYPQPVYQTVITRY
jgi:hypothetical protein